MYLYQSEALAYAHIRMRREEARSAVRAARLARAERAQRRAVEAALRSRRASAHLQ